jgi:hypothetical protein
MPRAELPWDPDTLRSVLAISFPHTALLAVPFHVALLLTTGYLMQALGSRDPEMKSGLGSAQSHGCSSPHLFICSYSRI